MPTSTPLRIALLAGISSLVFSFVIVPALSDSQRINPDPDRFGQLALSIAQGNGFAYEKDGLPVLERTPLYSFIVAGLFTLAGDFSLTAVQVYQAAIHGFTSFLLFIIIARTSPKQAAVPAQLIFALHPIVLWYTARIWVETTHTFLLLLVALCCILLLESPTYKRGVMLGFAIGLSCLIKPILLLFPAVVAVLVMVQFGVRTYKVAAVMLAGMLIVVMPWTLRNYEVSGRFIPVNTSLGFNLIQGTVIGEQWPSADKGILEYWHDGKARADSILLPHGLVWESAEGDEMLTRATFQLLTERPGRIAERFGANVATFWYLSESKTKSIFVGMLQLPLALAGVLSFVLMDGKKRRELLPLAILVAYYVILHSFIVGWGRYSMPLIPLLIVLAAPLASKIFVRTSV